jgi:hypothetical protein
MNPPLRSQHACPFLPTVVALAWAFAGPPTNPAVAAEPGTWEGHTVYQLNGKAKAIKLPSEYQLVSRGWPAPALVPYLAYMPEKDRVAMLVLYEGKNRDIAISFSDDRGATWSIPKYLHLDEKGNAAAGGLTLTYLGGGTLLTEHWISRDYGETWEALPKQNIREVWLPALVDRDPKTGKVTRLAKAYWSPIRTWGTGLTGPYSQAYISFSYDEGKTWQDEIKVPQWLKVCEIALARAANGDMVAACRLDLNQRLDPTAMDNYTGTGVSISKDNGKTWSDPFDPTMVLFGWGRTHMWLETLPDGDLVMTYNVRRGFPDAPSGYPQFGIGAMVSHDHGRTWDIDHQYIVHHYEGNVAARDFWSFQGAPSNAASAVLPDGSLLTAFNMEYTKIGLVKWTLNHAKLNRDKTYSRAPFDSALRNEFDPATLTGKQPKRPARANLAVEGRGAQATSSKANLDMALLLENPYLYSQFPPGVVLETSPAWVQITWPKAHKIDEVRILSGDPSLPQGQERAWLPLEYRLEYRGPDAEWLELAAGAQKAPATLAFVWHDEQKKDANTYQYVHPFAPVKTDAIRLTIARSADAAQGRSFLRCLQVFGK